MVLAEQIFQIAEKTFVFKYTNTLIFHIFNKYYTVVLHFSSEPGEFKDSVRNR